jgi:hypothetical protein
MLISIGYYNKMLISIGFSMKRDDSHLLESKMRLENTFEDILDDDINTILPSRFTNSIIIFFFSYLFIILISMLHIHILKKDVLDDDINTSYFSNLLI